MSALPDFLRYLIDSPPAAGNGVHAWLFKVARQLHAHLPAVQIVDLLEQRTRNCGRHVPRREIVAAVTSALTCAWQPRAADSTPAPPKWPALDTRKRNEIAATAGMADLWEASPVRLDDDEQHTEDFIDQLFPGDPLLCCGQSNSNFDTKPRSRWRGELAGLQFIVPSPMTSLTGKTQEGHQSAHSLDNTGPRRFLICEFDAGAIDEHAALLLHLANYAPLVLAVHSGGKSLHGWFMAAGHPDDKVTKFFRYAVSLGADRATWTRSQFVRMPDGRRDNGARQRVYFLNLKPV